MTGRLIDSVSPLTKVKDLAPELNDVSKDMLGIINDIATATQHCSWDLLQKINQDVQAGGLALEEKQGVSNLINSIIGVTGA